MIKLKPVEVADKLWMEKYMREEDSRSADFAFSTIFAWNDTYCQQAGEYGGRLILKLYHVDPPIYSFPIGAGPLGPVIDAILRDCGAAKLRIRGVTRENIAELQALYPNEIEITPDEMAWDYLYSAEKLATLSGKKLHAKRNYINRFIAENPDWSFEAITAENLEECRAMNEQWMEKNTAERHENFNAERMALARIFGNFSQLGLDGGLIRVQGNVIAFTIGERLNSDTFVSHYEKAFSDIDGAYPMINREFARYILEKYPDVQYINREDDMGHENLRKAKQSYYPEAMVEKYTATWK